MTADLLARAKAGDGRAFGELTEPHRRELQLHCYRMLGSMQDAEDVLQETFLAAWRGLADFEERSTLRTWLYRVATNRCLNALRTTRRRPPMAWPVAEVAPPPTSQLGEVVWLEPYPDALLDGLAASPPGPDARFELTEAISLAFITALQLLSPRQRAVLVLRDVLGYQASEVAGMLGTTLDSVTSALKRARALLQRRETPHAPAVASSSAAERELIARLVTAFQTGDVETLTELLTDDVVISMPPVALQYHGRELASQFIAIVTFRNGRTYDLVPTRANGQLAVAAYVRDRAGGPRRAAGLRVLTLSGNRICGLTRFENTVLHRFGLPTYLPGLE